MSSTTLLGTDYLNSLSPNQTSTTTAATTTATAPPTNLTPTICQNLSAFKNYLKISRSLDDSIILRFNRAEALLKQPFPSSSSSSTPSVTYTTLNYNPLQPSPNCTQFYEALLGAWNQRTKALNYCDTIILQQSKAENKGKRGLGEEIGLDRNRAAVLGRGESLDLVKRRAIHREIQVENIIRTRSLYLFQSRCPSHNLLPTPDLLPLPLEEFNSYSSDGPALGKGGRGGRDGKGGVRWNG